MSFFHKKEEVPRIPAAPSVQTVPEPAKEANTELPSLPSGLGQNVNQEIVKSAVNDVGAESLSVPEVEELPKDFSFEKSAMPPTVPQTPIIPPSSQLIPTVPGAKIANKIEKLTPKGISTNPPQVPSIEPIFVRIDKFQAAKKELHEINKKVRSVETTLGKLEEIKSKEDSEIDQLTNDLETLKARLSTVDSNVFQKA